MSRKESRRARRRSGPIAWGVATALALGVAAREVRASEEHLAAVLEWDAPSDCPSGPEAMDRIEQMVGRAGRIREPVRARVLVHVEPGGAWLGEVELTAEGARETRSLEGASCRQVTDAIVVMIAMVAAAEPPGPPPAPQTSPPAVAPPRARPTRGRKAFGVGLSGALDVGTFPSTALGGEIRFDWEPPHADIGLVVDALSPVGPGRLARITADPKEGASFWLARARVRGCYPMFGGVLAMGPCAGIGTEAVLASGFGSTHTSNATGWTATASLGGQVVLRLTSSLSVRLAGEGIAQFPRPSFVIYRSGAQLVYQVSPIAFSAAAGGEVHF